MMNFEYCDKCKVGKWVYEMNGDIICKDECPYKKEGDADAENRKY